MATSRDTLVPLRKAKAESGDPPSHEHVREQDLVNVEIFIDSYGRVMVGLPNQLASVLSGGSSGDMA